MSNTTNWSSETGVIWWKNRGIYRQEVHGPLTVGNQSFHYRKAPEITTIFGISYRSGYRYERGQFFPPVGEFRGEYVAEAEIGKSEFDQAINRIYNPPAEQEESQQDEGPILQKPDQSPIKQQEQKRPAQRIAIYSIAVLLTTYIIYRVFR